MSLADRLQRDWWLAQPTGLTRALQPLAGLYGAIAAARRGGYRGGLLASRAAPVPVLVVGNLIVGGAGKTPTVIALTRVLRAAGWQPGIVSRGYGGSGEAPVLVQADSDPAQVGDEPLLMRLRTQAPVCVGRDRVAAARRLCGAHPEIDLLIADDGLQHLRLARALEVWVFDERGIGNGRLLPAGPLRQPLPSVVPPQALVLYNAPAPSTPLPGALALRRLGGAVALADWWRGAPATLPALHALRGRPVHAAAGIASPQRFFGMLEAEGLQLRPCPLPDHHDYATLPWPADAEDVLVTEKDAIKLRPERVGRTRVWVVTLDFSLPADFVDAVRRRLPAPRAPLP